MPIAFPGISSAPVQPASATHQVPFPSVPVSAPFSYSSGDFNSPSRGIAALTFQGRTWRFRTNPNAVNWSYTLNTNVDQTYGGRVVQILSTRIDDMVVKVECGKGGWEYNYNLVLFLRDLLVAQRNPQSPPATFEYTTRNWKFNVFGLSIPFKDSVEATVRELELHFKVQEDVSGVVSGAILDATLAKLQDGIGWTRNQYNSGSTYGQYKGPETGPVGPIQSVTNGLNLSNPIQSVLNLTQSLGGGAINI
jgi:hypothetical protein